MATISILQSHSSRHDSLDAEPLRRRCLAPSVSFPHRYPNFGEYSRQEALKVRPKAVHDTRKTAQRYPVAA